MLAEPRGRLDRDARREAILDVARDVFLEEGFAAASMSTIAARLGGSKGTLYNYFASKDELFKAYVERRCLWQQDEVFAVASGETPEEALLRISRSFLTHVLSEITLRNFAVIAAESERSPELGRILYDTGPRQGAERLAAFLAGLDAAGALELEGDPLGAAHHLLGLLQSPLLKARLLNAIPPITPEQVDSEARRGVRAFLRAFAKR